MALIYYLTQIQFDYGSIALLQSECERVGITRPLVVTDAGVKAAGVLQKALDALPDLPVTVFDQTPSNPTEAAVMAAAALYKSSGCDGLIAVGGGSAIDCAKGVAIAATHEGPLTRYATIEGGSGLITERAAPLIAVPTTSGTGSEVARGAILIVDDHRKLGFHSWHLLPKAAICDPELTLGLPAQLTAATGMDAIAHCMETFMSAAFNPPADGIALDGLNPRLHHGTLNAMFLPAVVRFNAQAASVQKDQRLDRMAHAMGLASGGDVAEAILEMNARLGLPTGLAAMGVERAWFDKIITGAMADHCHKTNPRLATPEEYRDMLGASL